MRVWIKRIGVICLIPIALVLLLSILLYIPPFQNFAVRKATEYAGKATGMQIGIEQIRLSFPLDLTVKGVEVVNPPADTLLSLQSLTVRVRALPLLRKQVLVEAIDLRNVKVNTGTMIEGMEIKGFLGKLYRTFLLVSFGMDYYMGYICNRSQLHIRYSCCFAD